MPRQTPQPMPASAASTQASLVSLPANLRKPNQAMRGDITRTSSTLWRDVAAVFGGLAFHGPDGAVVSAVARSASESSAIILHSSGNGMPVAAAALGSRLVSVMPGMVLASSTNGRFCASSSTSTRE